MADILTDALAVLGVVLNGLPQGLLELTYGFASIPTALAFFVGAIGNTLTQSASFLFVLGIFKTVVLDAPTALSINAAVGGTTMVVTAVTNPFLGMLSGILVRLLGL